MSLAYTLFQAKLIPVLPFLLAEAISIRNSKPKLPSISENLTLGQSPNSVLILGESTVAGVGATEPQFSLAGQFFQLFEKNISVKNIGKNGLLAKNALQLLENTLSESGFNFSGIFIFLGANEASSSRLPKPIEVNLNCCSATCSKTIPQSGFI